MSLATDVRPYTFGEVVGQETTVMALKNIAKSDGVKVRSILLQGAYGSGKTTMSRIFGKAVNCTTFKKTGEVCQRGEECEFCKEAMRANSQTYYEFDSTRVGSVDQIKSMDMIFSAASPMGRRVICIDEVHACSKQAQSALLKVLEEGVKDTFFVFATTDAVLDTIKSRSVCFDITTIPFNMIKDRVRQVANQEEIEISESELDALAIKSKGHMRDALSILEHFALAGPAALKTPLRLLKKLVLFSLQKKDTSEIIHEVLLYPIVDVRSSISVMVKDFYVSDGEFETKIRKAGIHNKVFQFFYAPVAREAMKDEFGVEILLNSFVEMFRG